MVELNKDKISQVGKNILEKEVGHSLFECKRCGNQGSLIKCKFAEFREKRESGMKIICQQKIKRTKSCRNLHVENECLEYPGQFCWHNCNSNNSNYVCPKHKLELESIKKK